MENNEVVNVISTDVPAIADDQLLAIADQAEKRIDAVKKIKAIVLKLTNAHDWVDQQGKPYLQASGGEKVARAFGISWRIDEPVYDALDGGHFSYSYKGYFTLGGTTIEAIGTRSSKDPFFKKYEKGKTDDNGDKIPLPSSEIDKGDVKKAAYTNLIGNGITRLLGIRNLTYEELQGAGISVDKITKVEYAKEDNITIMVSDVRKKEGTNKKTGKPYTVYIVKDAVNTEYKTFSETLAKTAKTAKETGKAVNIVFKTGKFGNDIEELSIAGEDKEIDE
jgi:hypothetical protein